MYRNKRVFYFLNAPLLRGHFTDKNVFLQQKEMENTRLQTPEEEKANAITHGLGIVFTLVAIPFLINHAEKFGANYSKSTICVFGFGMLATYVSSTMYHAIQEPKRKEMWHICDHIAIFLLIGGTYTPVIFRHLPFDHAFYFMATMWFVILLGIVFKLFFTGRFEWLSLTLYVFLGWMIAFVAKPMAKTMSWEVFSWILYGSFAYMIGIVFYKWRSKKYSHAVWHCLVLMGTIAHFVSIYKSFSI